VVCAEISASFMQICIYGAGAIGGYLRVQLARAGAKTAGLYENTRSVEAKSPVFA
jgi:ketopantoate reductase